MIGRFSKILFDFYIICAYYGFIFSVIPWYSEFLSFVHKIHFGENAMAWFKLIQMIQCRKRKVHSNTSNKIVSAQQQSSIKAAK